MPARTGTEFLRGLTRAREVWVDGERVTDVTSHPAFAGAAHALADVFDLQHQAADVCLMPDPETGEEINVTHTIVQPTIDKSHGDVPLIGDTVALHKVENTSHGILVRGSRVLATLAPFADEIAV